MSNQSSDIVYIRFFRCMKKVSRTSLFVFLKTKIINIHKDDSAMDYSLKI